MEDMSEYTAKFNQAWRTMSEYKTEWVWPPLLKLPLLPAEPSKQNVAELHECVCVCVSVCVFVSVVCFLMSFSVLWAHAEMPSLSPA